MTSCWLLAHAQTAGIGAGLEGMDGWLLLPPFTFESLSILGHTCHNLAGDTGRDLSYNPTDFLWAPSMGPYLL